MTEEQKIYSENIKNLIMSRVSPAKLSVDKTELTVRCPFCGDSVKDLTHGHFNISLIPPYYVHCFKCNKAGVLNSNILNALQVYDNDIIVDIIKARKGIVATENVQNKVIYKKREIKYEESGLTKNALKYFNNRYGKEFDPEYVSKKFKCILDPLKFANDNRIRLSKSFDFENSIGFLSSDGMYAVFRDIGGQQKIRYHNLFLGNPTDDGSKIYNLRSSLDLCAEKVTLVMAEGIFDIIGVYEHFYKDNDENHIFAAACGNTYNAVIDKFIKLGFLDMDIIIYSDKDVDLYKLKKQKRENKFVCSSPITVYYNDIDKDYGVPYERIQLRKCII